MKPISSWGRLSNEDHNVVALNNRASATSVIHSIQNDLGIAYGMGRSYGDVGLNPKGILWHTIGLNHFIDFNQETGLLKCESGVLLRDIQRLLIPRGWALPVTPGTQLITVGGAIANDVHGKNHHALGSFGDHVRSIKLARTDGDEIECSQNLNREWFFATLGGIGLTGVIVEAEIQLRPIVSPWLNTETIPYSDLSEFFHLADCSEKDWEHTVSWVDCMSNKGRGIFMRANPSNELMPSNTIGADRKIPFTPPISLINSLTLRPLNLAYYNLKKYKANLKIEHYESFLYPLDKLLEWNRIYGPKGFFQYQCVIPSDTREDATQAMLQEIKKSGEGSFLAVLKTFGNREPLGMLSFPKPGATLALDFPNHKSFSDKLFTHLDAIVKEAKGRIYLAKDARMPRELFEDGYPKLNEFLKYRDTGISSSLSRRLLGN